MAAKKFPWPAKTLAKAREIAATVDWQRWLSLSGKTTLKVIAVLAKGGSVFKPTTSQVIDELVAIGTEFGWDLPNMTTPQEKAFLRWMVETQMSA